MTRLWLVLDIEHGGLRSLIYWKLYSSTPDSSITNWLRGFDVQCLHRLFAEMLQIATRNVTDILALVEYIGEYQLPGMASSDAVACSLDISTYLVPERRPDFRQDGA